MPPKTRATSKAASKQGGATAHNGSTAGEPQPTPPQNISKEKKICQEGPPQVSPDSGTWGKVAGARMSNFKHSGLLARDEKALKELLDNEAEPGLQLATQLVSQGGGEGSEEGGGEHLQRVSGRDIYAILSVGRSTQKAKKRLTERSAELNSTPTTSQGSKKVPRETGGNDTVLSGVVEADRTDEVTAGKCSKKSSAVGNKRGKGKGRAKDTCMRWSSDSEQDENSESSGEEDGEEEMASIAAQLNRGVTAEHALEDYFTAHAGNAGATSDRTLSRLARPRLEQQAVQTALQTAPSPFQRDCQQLYEEYTSLYPYWLLQMHSGFNILLYGLGSKKRLIEDFCKNCLHGSCHLVVNGFFPGLTVKQILSNLSSDLLGHSGSFKSHSEHAQFITSTLEKRSGKDAPREVFLLIHNLVGPMLRNERAQAALSLLAVSQHIHIVASVDHINAALLWDQIKLSHFNWLWHDVTTFEPYREETSYENSLLVQHSGSLALSSLTHVMKSLTPNARGIFELLAKYQLEHKKEAERNYQGLSFSECYRRCREKFLVNSDLTLRAQLTEFRDHKLVRSTKGSDGVEYLSILVDDATLSQFLND